MMTSTGTGLSATVRFLRAGADDEQVGARLRALLRIVAPGGHGLRHGGRREEGNGSRQRGDGVTHGYSPCYRAVTAAIPEETWVNPRASASRRVRVRGHCATIVTLRQHGRRRREAVNRVDSHNLLP
ncbi:hypothetical protein AB5I41_06960 [Sphingomonas sp. MMS24-JH45]